VTSVGKAGTGLTFAVQVRQNRMRSRFLVVLLLFTSGAAAMAQSAQQDAIKQTIAVLEKRLNDNPGDATFQYLLADYYSRAGRKDDAFATLEKLVGRPTGLTVDADTFPDLASDPRLKALATRLEKTSLKINRGRIAFTTKQVRGKEIIPEGIAYDEQAQRWFVSDLQNRRVLRVDVHGNATPWAQLRLVPLGVRVDRQRNSLWVASYAGDFVSEDKKMSALEQLDLRTGKQLARFTYPGAWGFNDVALAPNGDIYVTDSERGSVLRLRAGATALEEFIAPGSVRYPNGIAVSSDGKRVFVAVTTGIVGADTATKNFALLKHSVDTVAAGNDGLYFHDGSLIGVQNGIAPFRITRFILNPTADAITAFEVLESRNENFVLPTTGAITGGSIYVLANTQLRQLTAEGRIADPESLRDIVVLRVPLGK
jgi:DNA-binding beta-propeller fold protein YncE